MQKLASGQRINSAGDDPAGLSIANGLEAQRRGMLQAVRNMNDAGGFLNTAEGALQTQSDIIQRMRELSVQASKGTYATKDLAFLNTEFQSLLSEFNRLASQTQFNGVNLLDGSFGTTNIQVGSEKGQTISFSLPNMYSTQVFTTSSTSTTTTPGSTVGAGTFQARATIATGSAPYSVIAVDVNGDGKLDLITADYNSNTASIALGNGNGTFQARTTIAAGSDPWQVVAADMNGDGKLDLITVNKASNTASIV